MARAFRIPYPIKLDKLTLVLQWRETNFYVHWTVLVITAVLLYNSIHRPLLCLMGLAAYLSVLVIHECGHLLVARHLRCHVDSIKIYPIFGVTCFQIPWSKFDHCLIAWGGVIAQTIVAIPFVTWVVLFGYSRFEPINAVLALLGFFSLGVAIFNLLPIPRLDGAIAWQIIPEFIKRRGLFSSANSVRRY